MKKEVRVVQNKEPKHFLTIFKGKFVIKLGKEKENILNKTQLYQVQGTDIWNIYAIEVLPIATSLNTNRLYK